MRKFLALTLALAGITAGTAAPALARDESRCTQSPGSARMSEDAVKAKLADAGYKITRIKREHGCYEVHATDQSGTRLELRVDPASAKILRAEKDD
jgi:hypothetical protein